MQKKVEAYDEDSKLTIDYLTRHPHCTGRIGATGMCLGGHLALRCAFDPRILAAVTFFATDIHSRSLGAGGDDTLKSLHRIQGEILLIFGKKDPHVPPEGRDLIRSAMQEAGLKFSWYEHAQAQHAFVRDEGSKGRFDAYITKVGLLMMQELFSRSLQVVLGNTP